MVFLYEGCPNTSAKGLRFCQLHDQHATQFKDDAATNHANKDDPEDCTVIVQILNERCLRDGKIFEVRIDTFLW